MYSASVFSNIVLSIFKFNVSSDNLTFSDCDSNCLDNLFRPYGTLNHADYEILLVSIVLEVSELALKLIN
jgi:hypothetical protein